MTKLILTLLSTVMLSNVAWAQPVAHLTETNSLSKAVLEMAAMNAQPQKNAKVEIPYSHESEKNNSLSRAVLAKQGVKVNLHFDRTSEVSYSRYTNKSEQYNSLVRGAMAK